MIRAPFPGRRLELGHRHRQAAVAGERDDRPVAMDEGRRDRGRQRVAHRPGRRAEERPGPAEAEAAAGPAGEVAGVGRDDRVVGQDRAQRRDRRGPGWTPGPVQASRVPSTVVPPPRPRDRSSLLRLPAANQLGVEHGLADQALVRRAQERPRVGR